MVPLKPSKTPNGRYIFSLTINNGLGCYIIDLFLCWIRVECAIESEFLLTEGSLILLTQIQSNVLPVRIEVETYLGAHFYFFAIQRTNSGHHNNIPALNLDSLRGSCICWFGRYWRMFWSLVRNIHTANSIKKVMRHKKLLIWCSWGDTADAIQFFLEGCGECIWL